MSGDLPPGSSLPPIRELMDRFNAASATVRAAQRALRDEGFLVSRAGLAVFVRHRSPLVVRAATYFPPEPGRWSYELIQVADISNPPAQIAEALHLVGNALLRKRLGRYDGEPAEINWSYYPKNIFDGTALAEQGKIKGGAPAVFASCGYPQRSFTDIVSTRMPTSEEIELLKMSPDVPVLRQFRVIHSDNKRPIEATIIVQAGNRYEMLYEQEIPGGAD
ncbi:MAG: GntR family transcriptional regulator [Pseudonocardiales bacterium]|nr:GntR family transcriptional regulator [Pseudonocardiales bacterium]